MIAQVAMRPPRLDADGSGDPEVRVMKGDKMWSVVVEFGSVTSVVEDAGEV